MAGTFVPAIIFMQLLEIVGKSERIQDIFSFLKQNYPYFRQKWTSPMKIWSQS